MLPCGCFWQRAGKFSGRIRLRAGALGRGHLRLRDPKCSGKHVRVVDVILQKPQRETIVVRWIISYRQVGNGLFRHSKDVVGYRRLWRRGDWRTLCRNRRLWNCGRRRCLRECARDRTRRISLGNLGGGRCVCRITFKSSRINFRIRNRLFGLIRRLMKIAIRVGDEVGALGRRRFAVRAVAEHASHHAAGERAGRKVEFVERLREILAIFRKQCIGEPALSLSLRRSDRTAGQCARCEIARNIRRDRAHRQCATAGDGRLLRCLQRCQSAFGCAVVSLARVLGRRQRHRRCAAQRAQAKTRGATSFAFARNCPAAVYSLGSPAMLAAIDSPGFNP